MTNAPVIERIELTAFDIRIENLASGPGGLGVSYVPGPGMAQMRLAVRVFAGDGLVGAHEALAQTFSSRTDQPRWPSGVSWWPDNLAASQFEGWLALD